MAKDTAKPGASAQPIKQFCTFRLCGHLYGVDILDVKEVTQEASFTPIFHAPKEVAGYVNMRGKIHLVLNLHRILGLKDETSTPKHRLVLFKPSVGESFGVRVDAIGDVVEVDESSIESGSLANEVLGNDDRSEMLELISGVCRLEDSLLLLINARLLLRAIDKAMA